MLKISSSVEYAARVLLFMAGEKAGEPVSAGKIASSENIPRDYVDQILLRLRRAGLIKSTRGARGGYHLAGSPDSISVAAIVRAVDEGVFELVCDKYSAGDIQCSHTDDCGIRPVWQRLGGLVEDFLGRVTLKQLREEEVQVESRVDRLFKAPK